MTKILFGWRSLRFTLNLAILWMHCFNSGFAGDFSSGYGTPEINYRGIFDKGIYQQSLARIIAGKLIGHTEPAQAEKIGEILTEHSQVDFTDPQAICNQLTEVQKLVKEINDRLNESFARKITEFIKTSDDIKPKLDEKTAVDIGKRFGKLMPSSSVKSQAFEMMTFSMYAFNSGSRYIPMPKICKAMAKYMKDSLSDSRFILGLIDSLKIDSILSQASIAPKYKQQIKVALTMLPNNLAKLGNVSEFILERNEGWVGIAPSVFGKVAKVLAESLQVYSANANAIAETLTSCPELADMLSKPLARIIGSTLAQMNQSDLSNSQLVVSALLNDERLNNHQEFYPELAQKIGVELAKSLLQDKKQALKAAKLVMINKHFLEKIKQSNEYKDLFDSNRGWGETFNNIAKGVLSGIVGMFTYRGSFAVSQLADEVCPPNSILRNKLEELQKKVENLKEAKYELEKGVENEIVYELEQEYIATKYLISPSIQNTIETMFIRIRNEDIEVPQKWEIIKNALDIPYQPKKLDPKITVAAFEQNKHFDSFDDEVRQKLKSLFIKISFDSQAPDDTGLPVRTTCYFNGPPGSGKTCTVKEVAAILGLPCYEITINDIGELSRDNVVGTRGWQPKMGWLSSALMKKNLANERYTNGILLLNDYDRVLFHPSSNEPNPSALSFLLDLLDTEKREYHSSYFDAEIAIGRLNIFVTANIPLPQRDDKARKDKTFDPFAALVSRVDIVTFTGFSENKLSVFSQTYLNQLLEKYGLNRNQIQAEGLISEAFRMQASITGQQPVELRDLKKRLENLVLELAAKSY